MHADPHNPLEAEGVLNPATAWGDNGKLYLYPRLVGRGNVSRIGRGEVLISEGVPIGVERKDPVLGPDRGWEHGNRHGGTEDPRITTIPALGVHVMTYVAFGPLGPVPAVALSRDGIAWQRLGPLHFAYQDALDTDLNLFPNKDVMFFPEAVPGPHGQPSLALLHRPMWDLGFARADEEPPLPRGTTDPRAAIWISFVPLADVQRDIHHLTTVSHHTPLIGARSGWEELKVGAGTPPLRVPEGWLVLYHGVSGTIDENPFEPQAHVNYSIGGLILDPNNVTRVLARTHEPLMTPESTDERAGVVPNVVFPTAIEKIGDTHFVFYGMADSRIGTAILEPRSPSAREGF